ncbi:MAG: hypothetical protein K6U88_00205 [Dehalococcoidia bacterium]|nr:hypothetical protein [Dehalococcoidia bacterium]
MRFSAGCSPSLWAPVCLIRKQPDRFLTAEAAGMRRYASGEPPHLDLVHSPIGRLPAEKAIRLTLMQKQASATHWSTLKVAAVGICEVSVRRIWRAQGLKPHRWDAAYTCSLNRSFTFNPFR